LITIPRHIALIRLGQQIFNDRTRGQAHANSRLFGVDESSQPEGLAYASACRVRVGFYRHFPARPIHTAVIARQGIRVRRRGQVSTHAGASPQGTKRAHRSWNELAEVCRSHLSNTVEALCADEWRLERGGMASRSHGLMSMEQGSKEQARAKSRRYSAQARCTRDGVSMRLVRRERQMGQDRHGGKRSGSSRGSDRRGRAIATWPRLPSGQGKAHCSAGRGR